MENQIVRIEQKYKDAKNELELKETELNQFDKFISDYLDEKV